MGATLDKAALGAAKVGVETAALGLTYNVEPAEAPELAYQWQIANNAAGIFQDIEGATSATYTPIEAQAGLYLRCNVVATGGAVGNVNTNARKIAAAE